MERFTVLKNIKVVGGYKIDFAEIESRIPKMDIPDDNKQALGKYVQSCKKRNLTFSLQFSAFVKCNCGHWEHCQLAYAEWINDHIGDGNCMRCIDDYWNLRKRARF